MTISLPEKIDLDRAYVQYKCNQTADNLFKLEWAFEVFFSKMSAFLLEKKLEEARRK